jgi:hypothetical protein
MYSYLFPHLYTLGEGSLIGFDSLEEEGEGEEEEEYNDKNDESE